MTKEYKPKVILTIFAGRKDYLEILFSYCQKLIEKSLLDEVHGWDYCFDIKDKLYTHTFCKQNKLHFKLKIPAFMDNKYWDAYYKYYTDKIGDEDILIKCDDDIVFIDIEKFPTYLSAIKEGTLYSANVINNDVCAYYQKVQGSHNIPIDLKKGQKEEGASNWYQESHKALAIHKQFLSSPNKFRWEGQPIGWKDRLSINFIAGKGKTIKKIFLLHITTRIYDEVALTYGVWKYFKKQVLITPQFNVAHYCFRLQVDLGKEMLIEYRKLCPDLNGKLLSLPLFSKFTIYIRFYLINRHTYSKMLSSRKFEIAKNIIKIFLPTNIYKKIWHFFH